eukprot:GHRR01029666.1.p1 GENE.GHRR01029666.1~~GHRR01029666.1.p1  ORF type:complete len:206 (+),score=37.51 GHRR01029666.1:149-766(+)
MRRLDSASSSLLESSPSVTCPFTLNLPVRPSSATRHHSSQLHQAECEHPAAVREATDAEGHAADQEQHKQTSLVQECGTILSLGGPLFVEGVAAIGEQLVATSCVGHLADPSALSALVLAEAVYNVSGYSIVSGLTSALETLCGQAYGAGNYQLLPIMLVRAQLVCLVAIIPTALLWGSGYFAQLLPRVGQEVSIAIPASRCDQP